MKMQNAKHKTQNGRTWTADGASGFTLMELMVSISILVVIILSVGMTFSGASKAVGMSQATMEEMASIRAVQQAIARDIQAMDRDGFLVIACRVNWPDRNNRNNVNNDRAYRFDQISFLARGEFPNRSGANTDTPFTDSSTATAAHVWWGQGVMEVDPSRKPDDSYFPYRSSNSTTARQDLATPRDALPTGVASNTGSGSAYLVKENECTLLRHATLLFPSPNAPSVSVPEIIYPAGQSVIAYPGLEREMPNIPTSPNDSVERMQAHITSSRYANAAVTSADVMRLIAAERHRNASGNLDNQSPFAHRIAPSGAPEYDFYTYRFRALDSVYDTEVGVNPFVNGYFRSTPVVMRSVSSFRVDWTDGSVFPPNGYGAYPGPDGLGRAGQVKWYGPTGRGDIDHGPMYFGGSSPAVPDYGTDNAQLGGMESNYNVYGDDYVAVFGTENKAFWPKALRITIHVANDRIGGRDFVQIVNLPQ